MRIALGLALLFAIASCGEDEGAAGPPPAPPPPGGAKKPAPKTAANQLAPRMHVEERVYCPPPEKSSGPQCDKDAPSCDAGKFCLQVGNGWTCEPCPERDSIRHEFKDRDFVTDQTRDPFQSYIIVQKGLEEPVDKKEDGPCKRQDQFVATNYSYLDLTLVGVVAQGTQRKVLMMDRGNLGHIIRRGDCVGKEKAVVKDIGPGFVTFVLTPDDDKNPNRGPTERSIQLHPAGLQVAPREIGPTGTTTTAPVVAPTGGRPATGPTAPGPAPTGSAAPRDSSGAPIVTP